MSFRINGKGFFLTYSTHIDKKELLEFLRSITSKELVYYIIAHELGKKNYEHTHAFVWYSNNVDSRSPRKFDYEEIHPNIKTTHKGKKIYVKSIPAIYKYLTKEDGEPLTNWVDNVPGMMKFQLQKVMDSNSVQEAISHCYNISQVTGAIAAFNNREVESYKHESCIEIFRPWQEEVVDYLQGPIHKRQVLWIVDKWGGNGKTELANWCESNLDGCVVLPATVGQRDGAMLIEKLKPKIIWFDFDRTYADREMYGMIECCKNGRLFSGKYTGTLCRVPPMHVVVTSNFEPDTEKLSWDRWNIKRLEKPDGYIQPLSDNIKEIGEKGL